jgi:hypothetical protein
MDQSSKIWIILGALLGTLIFSGIALMMLCCWRRNRRRLRGFSLRAVTPLDDAEFESWRRPSQYTQRQEKSIIQPIRPISTQGYFSPSTPTVYEKDFQPKQAGRNTFLQGTMALPSSPISSIRKPERARRKSSVASSIADRPPTPYSPSSPTGDFPRMSVSSNRSQPLIHYPSMEETSAFRFQFETEYGTHQRGDRPWV